MLETGQAILCALMRLIQHLTQRHKLCTLVLNSAVGTDPTQNPNQPVDDANNVSIFQGVTGKPALGRAYAYTLDTSLFLSRGPTGDESRARSGRVEDDEHLVCLEVLYDRNGGREGRWAALKVDVSMTQ